MTYLSNVSEAMDVVVEMIACIKFRVLLAAVAVVTAACLVLAPVLGAPGEQIDYRRLVEFESTRTYSDELTVALASRDVRVAGRAALALGRTEDARAARQGGPPPVPNSFHVLVFDIIHHLFLYLNNVEVNLM